MVQNDNFFLKNYLSNIIVDVNLAGHNWVGYNWKDIDYIPDYNKFYYIGSGEGLLKINKKEYYPKPGQLFLMREGIKQSYTTINENPFTKYWCHFTAKIGGQNLFDVINLPDYINVDNDEYLISIFEELIKHFNHHYLSSALQLKATILKLISYYLENSIVETVKISNDDSIEVLNMVISYIDKNFSNPITVNELANLVHLHPNYFIKVFKNHMGTTPIQFLNKRRIDEARLLLTYSPLNITEVGEKIGIKNLYYFSKLFKQYTGMSPSTFKQLKQK